VRQFVKANSQRHARHDIDKAVSSSLVWRCELSRLDRQTGAFCVWSASESVWRRSATAGRSPTQNALVGPTQFTSPPPETTQTGPSCLVLSGGRCELGIILTEDGDGGGG